MAIMLVFMLNPIFAVKYQDSKNVFDASISYVNDQKLPYSVIVNMNPKVGSEITYEVEILYGKENIVVGSDTLTCLGFCESKVLLKKIFLGDQRIVIRTNYDGNYYEKVLKFNLQKQKSNVNINFDDIYYNASSSLLINGTVTSDIQTQTEYLFEFFPKGHEELKNEFTKVCTDKICDVNYELTSNIFLGDYVVRVYSADETFEKSFKIILYNESSMIIKNSTGNDLTAEIITNSSSNEKLNIENINLDATSIGDSYIFNNNLSYLENDIFDGNYIGLYYKLLLDDTAKDKIFELKIEENAVNYYLSTLFYNDYMIKSKSSTQIGSKNNYFAKFNISDYEIVYLENTKAQLTEDGYLNINKLQKGENIIVISKKEILDETNLEETNLESNRTELNRTKSISEILENTVFIRVINENTQELKSELKTKKNSFGENKKKTRQKVLLPSKFSNSILEFEMEIDENESNELFKIDNKMSRLIDKKQVSTNTLNYLNAKGNKINATMKFSGRDISFNNLELSETGIDLKAKKLNKRFEFNTTTKNGENQKIVLNDLFAIDPEKINFQNATMTKIAKGKALYKCKNWDYANDMCLGTWVKIIDLVPGQEYSLELDKYDPAFAESNILFEDDFELGGAYQSGLWTPVVEADSKLTQIWGQDTQYKYAGSYSLSDSPGGNYQPSVASTGFLPHNSIYSPPINLSGLTQANATFYQRVYLEANGAASCWDAILVKISINASTWNYTTLNGYTMRTISDNAQAERTTGDGYAMCDQYTNWTQVSINLTKYVGNQTVYIEWSMVADDNTGYDGYNIDNLVVYGTENQNPQLKVVPSFNPTSIIVTGSSYLNMTINDSTPINVIGTMKFSNGTIQNYTISAEIKPKTISYNVSSISITEKGANVTVFIDTFTDLRYWFVTIGTNLFDWNINTAQLRATTVTAPRPQYAALANPLDLRNFSQAIIKYQYKEQGVEEVNDCLLYSLNYGQGWSGDTTIFCDDLPLDNTYYSNNSIQLNSTYMVKNFQMRYGADQFDAEAVWIDNFNITAWHGESKTTGELFGPITYDNYTDITRINVTITVDSYSPNSSVNKSNTRPDLYLSLNDGTNGDLFNEMGVFNLTSYYPGNGVNTTDVNITLSVTDSAILNYFEANQGQRYIRIGAKYLDYSNSTTYDEIIYKSVTVTFEGSGQSGNWSYNFSNFLTPGTHNLTNLYISDYFGLTNNTAYNNVSFTVNAYSIISEGYLIQNNIYFGNMTTMKCNIVDNTTLNPLNNYNVTFYRNTTLLGSNLTNASGWAIYNFNDSSVIDSVYNITCNITNSASMFYNATIPNSSLDILYVWNPSADTEKPIIFAGSGTPSLANVGFGFVAQVNATDNQKVENVYMYVKKPGEGTYTGYSMISPGTLNGSGQYNYTFTGDSLSGTYYYYFRAEDNWTNPNWNTTSVNSFSRVVSDALIKINNNNLIYKRLRDVQLTSYTQGSISNTSVGEVTGYIGPYVIFNNSFSDEFGSWTYYTNPSTTSLYCGNGGVGYEDLDVDTGGSATSHISGADNSAARFSMESSSYTLGGTGYAFFEQNLSLLGYTTANVTFYLADNGVDSMVSGDYPFTLDIYDGTWYQSYTQQGNGLNDVTITAADYALKTVALSGYNMINNFKIRFSGGGANSATTDHFAVDDVVVVGFATDKTSKSQNYTFGSGDLNLSFFNVQVTVSSYSNNGSVSNTEPDLSIEFYNGTAFASKNYCNLEVLYNFTQNTSLTDINCSVQITNSSIISAWENPQNRIMRVNAEYIDVSINGSDSVNWTNAYFNYYTPSLIYNPGIVNISSYVSNRFYLNDTNELKGTVNITPVLIQNGSIYNLSQAWNAQNVSLIDLPNTVYYSSSALTDGSGNIIKDTYGNDIVSIDYFNIQNMYVNITSPIENKTYLSSQYNYTFFNVTLDTTYYASGGWCAYSLNSNATLVNMTKINSTDYSSMQIPLLNFTEYDNTVIVYCNDSTSDIVVSKLIPFIIDIGYNISFIPPTDLDGAFVNRSDTDINVSIVTLRETSAFINFNNSLVCYYNFENLTGNTVLDFSGYSNNATLNGSKITNLSMVRGNYSTYNISNNEFTEIINPNAKFKDTLNGSSDFTISAYVNVSLISGSAQVLPIFESYNSSGNYINFGIESGSGVENIYFIASNNSVNTTISTGDLNITNSTWVHTLVTLNSLNSTHSNLSIYFNGNYNYSSLIAKDKFSNALSKYYIGKSSARNKYINGSIDEFLIFNRALSPEEIRSLKNSKLNPLEHNFTKLLNGNYSYQACVNNQIGNYTCTEIRSININLTLPIINITSPINATKVNYNESIVFNITTTIPVNYTWYQLDNNGTYFNMTNTSILNWNSSSFANLTGGYHLITVYVNDSIGNMVSANAYFYIVYQMDVNVNKSIIHVGNDSYFVSLNITNFGKYQYYKIHDFIDSNFSYYNLSVAILNSSNISGNEYTGKILLWNLTLPSMNSTIISYYINGTSDYNLRNNFMVGSE